MIEETGSPTEPSYRCMAKRPDSFVHRHELDEIAELLCRASEGGHAAIGITTALSGAGGFGKTALAQALAMDPRIRRAFPDGVLWAQMGDGLSDRDRLARLYDPIRWWDQDPEMQPAYDTVAAAGALFRERLAGQRVLVIIDDVWSSADLEPFRGLGQHAALVVTTRKPPTLPSDCKRVDVDAMRHAEAVKLLASGLGEDARLGSLAQRLGEWPLLLDLVNRQLHLLVKDHGLGMSAAIERVEASLARGLEELDIEQPSRREEAVRLTMQVSLDTLSPEDRQRYLQLAVFPEDAEVSLAVLARFWQLDDAETEKSCRRLFNLSLLRELDLSSGTTKLHDVFREYLLGQHEELSQLHVSFLGQCCPQGGLWSSLQPDNPGDTYLWHNLAYHLIAANEGETLRNLLFDFDYLWAKLNATNVNAIMDDFSRAIEDVGSSGDADLQAIQGALGLSFQVLSRDGNLLAGQLLGRLSSADGTSPGNGEGLERLLERARKCSWFRPRIATLTAPGGQPLIQTLEGHEDWVRAVAVIDERRAVSASDDRTLCIWDVVTGETLRTLEGHEGWIRAVAVIDNRWIVSASDDKTLRVWDPDSNKELCIHKGHDGVNAVAAIDEDRIISASRDGTLRVLNVMTGEVVRIFEGHEDWVRAVAVIDKRRVVSASDDKTLCVWDLETGTNLRILEGHDEGVNAVARVDENRVVSASSDHTLRLWDLETGKELRVFEKGHNDAVNSVVVVGDGTPSNPRCVISVSSDKTLRKWDVETGELQKSLKGHIGAIYSVAAINAGISNRFRVVSASSDHTLKVWEVATEPEPEKPPRGHLSAINGIAVLDTGREDICNRFVSISSDRTLRVWDMEKGIQQVAKEEGVWADAVAAINDRRMVLGEPDGGLRVLDLEDGEQPRLKEHKEYTVAVNAVARIDERRVVSASSDHTLRIWNVETRKEDRALRGHTSGVLAVVVIDAGDTNPCRIVSASDDDTLRVWDAETGEPLATLEGHKSWINAVAKIDEKRIVSASADHTLRVWNIKTGKQLRTLEGHDSWVNAVAVIDERRFVSASSDHTLRLWDIETDEAVAIFALEAPAQCIAFDRGTLVAGDQSGKLHIFKLAGKVEFDGVMDRRKLVIRSDTPHDFQPQESSAFDDIAEDDWSRHLGVTLKDELPDIGRTDQKGEPPTPAKMKLLSELFLHLFRANRTRAGVLFADYLWGPLFYIYDERGYMRKLLEEAFEDPPPESAAQVIKMREGEVFVLNQLANALRADISSPRAARIHQAILSRDEEFIKRCDTEEEKFRQETLQAIRLELLGLDQINIGRYADAQRNLESCRDLSLRLEQNGFGNANRASCLRDLGRLHIRTGEDSEALELLKEAGTLARKGDARKYLARILAFQSTAYLRLGETEKALYRSEAAVDSDKVRKGSRIQPAVLLVRAEARRANGDLKGAIEDVQQVLGRKRIDPRKRISAEILLGRIQLKQGGVKEAREATERALVAARKGRYAGLEEDARLLLAQIRQHEEEETA